MNAEIQVAAKALGLPEQVLSKFLSLVDSLKDAPTITSASDSATPAPSSNTVEERLQSLIEEYDRKL